jgi:hypothetical protein
MQRDYVWKAKKVTKCQRRNKTPAFLPVLTTAAAASGERLARLSC